MLQPSVRLSDSGKLRHRLFSAAFITNMFGFEYSVRTANPGPITSLIRSDMILGKDRLSSVAESRRDSINRYKNAAPGFIVMRSGPPAPDEFNLQVIQRRDIGKTMANRPSEAWIFGEPFLRAAVFRAHDSSLQPLVHRYSMSRKEKVR